jgi:hypothetical protein
MSGENERDSSAESGNPQNETDHEKQTPGPTT